MTDFEFEILDELYFINSFHELMKCINCSEAQLLITIQDLYQRGLIKLVEPVEGDRIPENLFDISSDPTRYHFLITKEGLLAHNSR